MKITYTAIHYDCDVKQSPITENILTVSEVTDLSNNSTRLDRDF